MGEPARRTPSPGGQWSRLRGAARDHRRAARSLGSPAAVRRARSAGSVVLKNETGDPARLRVSAQRGVGDDADLKGFSGIGSEVGPALPAVDQNFCNAAPFTCRDPPLTESPGRCQAVGVAACGGAHQGKHDRTPCRSRGTAGADGMATSPRRRRAPPLRPSRWRFWSTP